MQRAQEIHKSAFILAKDIKLQNRQIRKPTAFCVNRVGSKGALAGVSCQVQHLSLLHVFAQQLSNHMLYNSGPRMHNTFVH